MPDFSAAAHEFLANSTLQHLYGSNKTGWPDSYKYLVNQAGCEAWLGTGSQHYDWDQVSGTINTWVLPFTGLLLQAPFDSNDFLGTFWNIMRWVGGCMASTSYVLWNMRTTANCAAFVDTATKRDHFPDDEEEDVHGSKRQSDFSSVRDAFFILSVMNQFTLNTNLNGAAAEKLIKIALFSKELHLPAANAEIGDVRRALARDTREARKRGTVQCFLSMGWFIFGMVISIQESFGLLGENATAHNLALGLAMIWFAVLILCTVVDRNPAVPEATVRQLNTFLMLVRDAILRDAGHYGPDGETMSPSRSRLASFDTLVTGVPLKVQPVSTILVTRAAPFTEKEYVNWFNTTEAEGDSTSNLRWVNAIAHPSLDEGEFFVRFAGQGRVMWHYGVAHPIMRGLKTDGVMKYKRGWMYEPNFRAKLIRTANYDRKDRIHSFDFREFWQISMAMVSIWASVMSAFVISYFQPTIGLGCRALGYVVFGANVTGQMIIEMVIWQYTPHSKSETVSYQQIRKYGRMFLMFAEFASTTWLLYIMFAQVVGSYNTCHCKCSNYGIGGGFIDWNVVANPSGHQVIEYWIVGTALGCTIMMVCFAFIAWEWVTQSHLSTENYQNAMSGLKTTRRCKKWTKIFAPLQA